MSYFCLFVNIIIVFCSCIDGLQNDLTDIEFNHLAGHYSDLGSEFATEIVYISAFNVERYERDTNCNDDDPDCVIDNDGFVCNDDDPDCVIDNDAGFDDDFDCNDDDPDCVIDNDPGFDDGFDCNDDDPDCVIDNDAGFDDDFDCNDDDLDCVINNDEADSDEDWDDWDKK